MAFIRNLHHSSVVPRPSKFYSLCGDEEGEAWRAEAPSSSVMGFPQRWWTSGVKFTIWTWTAWNFSILGGTGVKRKETSSPTLGTYSPSILYKEKCVSWFKIFYFIFKINYSETWTKMSSPLALLMNPWPFTLQKCLTMPCSIGCSIANSPLKVQPNSLLQQEKHKKHNQVYSYIEFVLVRFVMIGLGVRKFLNGEPIGLRESWLTREDGMSLGSDMIFRSLQPFFFCEDEMF